MPWLNDAGAKYIVIGGWAVIQHGFGRTTTDIDLLVDASRENFEKIKTAMAGLPDGAIREVQPDDLEQFVVVRVGGRIRGRSDESGLRCRVREAVQDVSQVDVQGVMIPFANPKLLWRLKQTYREKGAWDRAFLKKLLNDRAG